jgi:hypothetical protein
MMKKTNLLIAICFNGVMVLQAQKITKAEYFFDIDKGIGKNSAIEVKDNSAISEISFTATVAGQKEGLHTLYCRVADQKNQWSIAATKTIQIISVANKNLVKGEYFFDTDPGLNKGTPITFAKISGETDVTFSVALSPLKKGLHTLYARVLDTRGIWSIVAHQLFYIAETEKIVKLEYYFSGKDGNSPNYSYSNFEPGSTIDFSESDFLANTSTLTYDQEYKLYVRALNSNRKYSSYSSITFTFKKLVPSSIDDVGPTPNVAFAICPNPASDEIHFSGELIDNKPSINFAIYDQTGKKLMNSKLLNRKIDISNITTGIYYIVLYSGSEVYSAKFIKN